LRTSTGSRPGFVVGLTAEARVAERFGYPVRVGGGTPEGAAKAAYQLVEQGANALVSFGFAGGLDPALRPGSLVIPASILSEGHLYAAEPALAARFGGLTGHCLVAGTSAATNATSKRQLHTATQAHAIDLESGSVARVALAHGLPFVAVRAISDAADRDLPPAALLALDQHGRVDLLRVLASLLRQPRQLPALLRLASDAARARRALVGLTVRRLSGQDRYQPA
jgi:adenosylhomocysteine nucleosidase